MSGPHWLLQELAGEAVWTSVALGVAYAWNKRAAIKRTLTRAPLVKNSAVHIQGSSSLVARPRKIVVSVTDGLGIADNVTTTVSSERTALWNIEAPTHPQIKRLANELLELGLCYLRS